MPFYKINLSIKKADSGRARQSISVIREYVETDLDRIWHMLYIRCSEKWGRLLQSFDCVQISKRSPDYLNYVKDKQQKAFNQYDDILSPVYPLVNASQPTDVEKPQSVNGKYRNRKG